MEAVPTRKQAETIEELRRRLSTSWHGEEKPINQLATSLPAAAQAQQQQQQATEQRKTVARESPVATG